MAGTGEWRARAQRERRDAYLRVMSDCARMGGCVGREISKIFCVTRARAHYVHRAWKPK